MTNKSLKIEINVSMYESIDELKDSPAIDNIMSKVVDILKKKGQKASNGSLLKYYTVVPNASSDEEVSETSVDNDSIDNVTDCQLPSPVSSGSHIFFSIRNNVCIQPHNVQKDHNRNAMNDYQSLSEAEMDSIIGRTFPYNDILNDDIAKSARLVVNKFKEILRELNHNSIKRKGVLKRLSPDFVKEFRQSGLRTTVTPYIHIIGNHLFEFEAFNDLGDYNMQGVEKNNDLLSRLYFSSTNPAKNPLLTMLQKLYRMLEMNFQDEKERGAMAKFARTGVYDFVGENLSESESDTEDHTILCRNKSEYIESEDEREEQLDSSIIATDEDDKDETELEESNNNNNSNNHNSINHNNRSNNNVYIESPVLIIINK
ncbi:unnamed protein product [Rotaria sordida]|uniref:Uncharacterized protein n=2 Tax=Rotaria sordida TaxID=392033 RepID=A0A819VUV6_9BILA|nr:unnamed protein product [Rotaria sordida]